MAVKKLPVYQAMISPNKDSDLVVDCVAIVDAPAIEKTFLAFKKEINLNFAINNTEERIVVGPAMIPDLLIYRNNQLGEHNVFFTKETVQEIAEKFYAMDYHKNANEMHDSSLMIDGFNFFMSFIRNSDKGMIGLAGDYPDGTWFLGAKVTDDTVWEKIKSGEYKGFSVEGLFQYKISEPPVMTDEQIATEVEALMESEEPDALDKIKALLFGTNSES